MKEYYLYIVYLHLATVLPAFVIGTYLMFSRKGSPIHRLLGKIYMSLMFFTAIVSLFIPAFVGPTIFGHFGLIHLLSILTLFVVPSAYLAAKRHNVKRHRNAMIALYAGGLLLAGFFAFMPGRLMHTWLFV